LFSIRTQANSLFAKTARNSLRREVCDFAPGGLRFESPLQLARNSLRREVCDFAPGGLRFESPLGSLANRAGFAARRLIDFERMETG
jgi:hypothetical protein